MNWSGIFGRNRTFQPMPLQLQLIRVRNGFKAFTELSNCVLKWGGMNMLRFIQMFKQINSFLYTWSIKRPKDLGYLNIGFLTNEQDLDSISRYSCLKTFFFWSRMLYCKRVRQKWGANFFLGDWNNELCLIYYSSIIHKSH